MLMSGDCSRSGNVCSICVSHPSQCRVDSVHAEWISACHVFVVVVHCTFTVLGKKEAELFLFQLAKILF